MPSEQDAMVYLHGRVMSRQTAAALEADAFLDQHPEYFVCPENQSVMTAYMVSHNLAWTYRNLEKAYLTVKANGLLRSDPETESKQEKARRSAESKAQFLATTEALWKEHGIVRYGRHGTVIGGGLEEFRTNFAKREPSRQARAGRVTESMPLVNPHPEDLAERPSKRDFATWDADRQKRWLIETGYWGRDLPEYLQ